MAEAKKNQSKQATIGCFVIVVTLGLGVAMCSSEPTVPEKPQASAKADAIQINARVTELSASCDAAFGRLSHALGGEDTVAAFQAAEVAESHCLSTDFDQIEIPISVGRENHEALKKAIENCTSAYSGKYFAAKSLKAAIDGNQKPSTMASIQRAGEMAQRNGLACAAGLAAVALKLGATGKELGFEGAKP